jgi:hypothetical protein
MAVQASSRNGSQVPQGIASSQGKEALPCHAARRPGTLRLYIGEIVHAGLSQEVSPWRV